MNLNESVENVTTIELVTSRTAVYILHVSFVFMAVGKL